MKKIKYLLLALTVLSFAACENGTSDNGSSSKTNQGTYTMTGEESSYSIPSDVETIDFPTSANGKKCFVIYSNDTSADISLTGNTVSFNENDVESRSGENTVPVIINKNVIRYNDGFYRDEVRFEASPKEPILSRAANNSSYYNPNLPDEGLAVGDTREFTIADHETTTNGKSQIVMLKRNFTLKAVGSKCRIWYLNNNSTYVHDSSFQNSNRNSFEQLASSVDSYYQKELEIFGSNVFGGYSNTITTTSSTKLEILVYDIFSDATSTQNSGTFGFFNTGDFYKSSYTSNSNECQLINIDSYFLQYDLTVTANKQITHKVESTIIHELQHLLDFCNKKQDTATWFNEMLSMCAEDIFQTQINLTDYDSPKGRFDGDFGYPYKGFGYWPESSDSNVFYAYANAYAFGAYLMRNYGGIRLIHEIATNSYVNKNAITRALQTLGYNETFESVFKKFGMVYINTNSGDDNSLNRNVVETYHGTTYNLGAINLNDYYITRYINQTECLNDLNNLYRETESPDPVRDSNTGYYYLQKPRIFKSSYTLNDPIKSCGFTVFYLGTVQSGKSIKVPKNSNLGRTIVLK